MGFDGAVTGAAGLLGVHVVGMTEEDEVGKLVDPDPLGLLSLPMQDLERLDSGIVLPDRVVAGQADGGRRKAGSRPLGRTRGDSFRRSVPAGSEAYD